MANTLSKRPFIEEMAQTQRVDPSDFFGPETEGNSWTFNPNRETTPVPSGLEADD